MTDRALALVACLALILSGCTPNDNKEVPANIPNLSGVKGFAGNNPRVNVERLAVIYDEVAYRNCRGIYLITDTKTGKQFIGVSGIGISDLGATAVSTGKTAAMVPYER